MTDRDHRSIGPRHARSDSHDDRHHDARAHTPGRATLAESLPPAAATDTGRLGREAGTQLRMLAEQVRQTLSALEVATTDVERDAAIDALDLGVELAMAQVPATQVEPFRAELRTRLGTDTFDALGEELADTTGTHGARSATFLGVPREGADAGSVLPAELRAKFEGSLGADLSGVRVHTGARAERSAEGLGARAFASGTNIHFGAGEYQPHTPDGEHLLAHEVAHTVQGGPAPRRKALVTGVGDAAEHEADHAADAMTSGETFSIATTRSAGIARTPHGHHGRRRRGRRADHRGDAAALDRELSLHADTAAARLANARTRAMTLHQAAETQVAQIHAATQHALHTIEAWRSTLDERALAGLDGSWGGTAWSVTTLAAGLLVRLNPIAETIYSVVDIAIQVGTIIANLPGTSPAHAATTMSAGLASGAHDDVLAQIMNSEHAATHAFDVLYGQLLSDTSVSAGRAGGMIAEDAAAEHRRLADHTGPVSGETIDTTERTATHALDAADLAEQEVRSLELALSVLRAAPAQITTGAQRTLARAQMLFANVMSSSSVDGAPGTQLHMAGEVHIGRGSARLSVGEIGSDEHSTPLDATLDDLVAMGASLELRLACSSPELVPQIFDAPAVTETYGGELVLHVTSGGAVSWTGVSNQELGRMVARGFSDVIAGDRGDQSSLAIDLQNAILAVLHATRLASIRSVALAGGE